jgi:hypothetical protein
MMFRSWLSSKRGQVLGGGSFALRLFPVTASASLLLCLWPAAPEPKIVFENVAQQAGISMVVDNSATPEKHQVETMLSGVALFDYDNDGLLDLYVVNGASLPSMDKSNPKYWNRLYHNDGNGKFTDVTEKAHVRGGDYGMGVAAADYDNDGYVDLFIAGVNRNQLLHNNGDGTFTDITEKAGLSGVDPRLGKMWSMSAGWFDYDNDGLLDLLVINYVRWSIDHEPGCRAGNVPAYCSPASYTGAANLLYHNNGDGTFTDVSESSGISKLIGKGMGVAFADYDGDGWTDVFVSNDTTRNFLLHNNRDGTFQEVALPAGVAYNDNGKSIAGMGTDFRDVFNDGRPDVFVVGMVGDTFPLFRNTGRGFIDVTSISGVARATFNRTAWGSAIADFDNDGNKDLFAACASILDNSEVVEHRPSKQPNLVLRNLGNGKFEDVSQTAGVTFQWPGAHRGVAVGDLNNDGRLDVVVTNLNARPEVFLNRSPGNNHWILIRLIGVKSNRDGLGAKVMVVPAGGQPLYNHATTSVGLGGSSDRRVHFGLGASTRIDRIEISWPGGHRQTLSNVAVDQVLNVREQ